MEPGYCYFRQPNGNSKNLKSECAALEDWTRDREGEEKHYKYSGASVESCKNRKAQQDAVCGVDTEWMYAKTAPELQRDADQELSQKAFNWWKIGLKAAGACLGSNTGYAQDLKKNRIKNSGISGARSRMSCAFKMKRRLQRCGFRTTKVRFPRQPMASLPTHRSLDRILTLRLRSIHLESVRFCCASHSSMIKEKRWERRCLSTESSQPVDCGYRQNQN